MFLVSHDVTAHRCDLRDRISISKSVVVFFVRPDPFPEEDIAGKLPNRAIMATYAHRPVGLADGFKVQGGMKVVGGPELIVLSG